jgi:hypothetical protein
MSDGHEATVRKYRYNLKSSKSKLRHKKNKHASFLNCHFPGLSHPHGHDQS